MDYKTLKVNFNRKGFEYNLVKRVADKAIYEQLRNGKVVAYEVVRIRRHDGYTLGDVFIEPSEIYPSDNEWGAHGFTCRDLKSAEIRLESL